METDVIIQKLSIEEIADKILKKNTERGETVVLKYHPLSTGRPRWDMEKENGNLIMGSLRKSELIEGAARASLNVVDASASDKQEGS